MNSLEKLVARSILGFSMGMFALTAWAVPPVKYIADPVPTTDVQMIDCAWFGMDFEVMGGWVRNEYGQYHFDNEGSLQMINAFYYLTEQILWNSHDPDKNLKGEDVAGQAEHAHYIWKFDENGAQSYMESGVTAKMVVPGYGQLRLDAGHVHWVYIPDSDEWIQVLATPNTSPTIEDAYAICVYLQ